VGEITERWRDSELALAWVVREGERSGDSISETESACELLILEAPRGRTGSTSAEARKAHASSRELREPVNSQRKEGRLGDVI